MAKKRTLNDAEQEIAALRAQLAAAGQGDGEAAPAPPVPPPPPSPPPARQA